jgi:hypothetical protein
LPRRSLFCFFLTVGSSIQFTTLLESFLLLLAFQIEFLFVGATILVYSGAGKYGSLNLFDQALLGFCLVSGFAQAWSIFSGLCPVSNYFLLGCVVILAVIKRRDVVDFLSFGIRATRIRSALVVLIPVGLAAAYNSTTRAFCYDNSLYHFLSVRWMAEYGSVTGLANLHGRLGFNSSLVALAGIFAVPFGVSIGREFINGATTVLVAGVLSQGLRFVNWRAVYDSRNLYAFGLLTFVSMLALSRCLSSPQPDVSSAALAIASAWYFLAVVKHSGEVDQLGANQLLCICASVATLEIKLSYIGFAAATILVVLIAAVRRRLPFRQNCTCLLFALIIFIPWICCGYITSGCPFFPSEFGRLPLDWAVPHALAVVEKNAAFAWARAPGLQPEDVLANWNWLAPWSARVLGDPLIFKPLLAGIVGLLMVLGRLLMQPLPFIDRRWFVLLVPSSVGLLFWFLTAPDPRFAQATLWVFALNLLMLPFRDTDDWSRRLNFWGMLALAILALFDAGVGCARLKKEKKRLPNIVPSQNELAARSTNSGLVVWIPTTAYEPGDAQLVATPPDRFNPGLELRGSNLRGGFRIRPPLKSANQ